MSTKSLSQHQRRIAALGQASANAHEMSRPKSEFEQRRATELATERANKQRSRQSLRRTGMALIGLTLAAVSPPGQKVVEAVDSVVNPFAVEQYQPTAEQRAAVARGEAAEAERKNPSPDSYLPPKDTWVTVTAEQATVPWAVAQDALPETAEAHDGDKRAELANDLIEQSAQNGSAQIDAGEQFSVPPEVVDQIDPKTIVER